MIKMSNEENMESLESNDNNISNRFGHKCRQLSEEEVNRLTNDTTIIPQFRQNKLEIESKKNWDLFYKRNSTKFFRDRHWTKREFEELIDSKEDESIGEEVSLLEVGSGVGNFIWPLIQEKTNFRIFVCDFSPIAIDLLKKNPLFDQNKCNAFVADITDENGIKRHLSEGIQFNLISLVFVLSSINPNKMRAALNNIYEVLRPDGLLLFRDYGLYDHAMLRFSSGHKLSDNFYVRQDGTRAYYFSLEYMESLVTSCGFKVITNDYIRRETVNHKEGLSVERIFIQGKYSKAHNCISSQTQIASNP